MIDCEKLRERVRARNGGGGELVIAPAQRFSGSVQSVSSQSLRPGRCDRFVCSTIYCE